MFLGTDVNYIVLTLGLLYSEYSDAIKEGDGLQKSRFINTHGKIGKNTFIWNI